MIVGIGLDVADIARFEQALTRAPSLRERLFAPSERDLPIRSLAARFAAKEALAKALGSPGTLHWHDAVVVREASGRPVWQLSGTVADQLAVRGGKQVHLSLTHDAGVAAAVVVVEG